MTPSLPPVGDTTQPADDRVEVAARAMWEASPGALPWDDVPDDSITKGCCRHMAVAAIAALDKSECAVTTQPQPTDECCGFGYTTNECPHKDAPGHMQYGHQQPRSSESDFVAAVAEIRALHREHKGNIHCCVHDRYGWPCPTIRALDEAGVP